MPQQSITRRTFIQTGAAATTAALTAAAGLEGAGGQRSGAPGLHRHGQPRHATDRRLPGKSRRRGGRPVRHPPIDPGKSRPAGGRQGRAPGRLPQAAWIGPTSTPLWSPRPTTGTPSRRLPPVGRARTFTWRSPYRKPSTRAGGWSKSPGRPSAWCRWACTAARRSSMPTRPSSFRPKAGQGDRFPLLPHQQHVPQRHWPGEAQRPAGRPELGHVAGPAAAAALPGQHRPLQVPLVASLFLADRQQRRPFSRSDPLDDRRSGADDGSRPWAAVTPSTTTARSPTPWRRCSNRPPAGSRFLASTRPTAIPRCRSRAISRSAAPRARPIVDDSLMNVIPERGGQFQDHRPRMAPVRANGRRRQTGQGQPQPFAHRPARPQFPGLPAVARVAPLRRGDRPSLDDLCQPGQHRPGHRRAIGMGRRARSDYQLSEGQRAAALRVSQAVVVGLTRRPLARRERARVRAIRQRTKRSPRPPGEG